MIAPSPACHTGRPRSRPAARRVHRSCRARLVLQRYRAPDGAAREVIAFAAHGWEHAGARPRGGDAGDARLVAHLAADEPVDQRAGRLRPLRGRSPLAGAAARCRGRWSMTTCAAPRCPTPRRAPCRSRTQSPRRRARRPPSSRRGARRRSASRSCAGCASRPTVSVGPALLVSVRDVVGALQDYEPVRNLTRRGHPPPPRRPGACSVAVLRTELARIAASPIVLNRRLREQVVQTLARDGTEHERDRGPLRAGQARPARQRQRRDELAGATSRAAARGRRAGAHARGSTRRFSP